MSNCLYCGVDMHEFSPKAKYCVNCYNKYGPWECKPSCKDEDYCECPPPEAYLYDLENPRTGW